MEKTTTKTFSIDSKLYERFETLCKSKNLNKSAVIQSAIKNFVAENYDIDKNSYYRLKSLPESELVKIETKESEFIVLSNGNKLNIFDFEVLYEMQDPRVDKVLNSLIGQKGVISNVKESVKIDDGEIVDPSFLEKPSIDPVICEQVKKACMTVDVSDNRTTPKTIVREITNDEIVIEKTKDDMINELKEKYQIENKTEIVKRIKEKRSEISELIKKIGSDISKQYDISNLEKHLSYIYETDVIIDYKDKYYINIPKKYVDNNFKNLLNGFEYEVVDTKEKTTIEKIHESLKNFVNQDYSYVQEKCNHIADNLAKIIKPALYGKDSSIDIKYDTPLYTIVMDKKFVCQELIDFISKSYGIKKDYIILKGI